MIEVLVCDDDREFMELEREVIEKSAEKYKQEVWVDCYQSGKDLIHALTQKEETRLCIALLDIDMPGVSGYDVAKIMYGQYPEMLIFFVSAREDLVFDSFEYRPFRFIRKSQFQHEICHALRKAFEVMERRMQKRTEVVSQGETVLLAHEEILYMMMQSRKVCFYLSDGRVLKVRGTMKGMLEKLADKKLIRINSGCAVNADQVDSYTSDTVFMKNGEKLPVSRDRAKEVKLQIEENWRK